MDRVRGLYRSERLLYQSYISGKTWDVWDEPYVQINK